MVVRAVCIICLRGVGLQGGCWEGRAWDFSGHNSRVVCFSFFFLVEVQVFFWFRVVCGLAYGRCCCTSLYHFPAAARGLSQVQPTVTVWALYVWDCGGGHKQSISRAKGRAVKRNMSPNLQEGLAWFGVLGMERILKRLLGVEGLRCGEGLRLSFF